VEPAGQVVTERAQVPVRDDRFRNCQKCPVLIHQGDCLCVS
jgi:hypothetical protein